MTGQTTARDVVRVAYVEDNEGKIKLARDAFEVPDDAYSLEVLSFDDAFDRSTEGTDDYWSHNFDVVLLDLGDKRPHKLYHRSAGFELAQLIVDQDGPPIALVTVRPRTDEVVQESRALGIVYGVYGGLPDNSAAWRELVDVTRAHGKNTPAEYIDRKIETGVGHELIPKEESMLPRRWRRLSFRGALDEALDAIVDDMVDDAVATVGPNEGDDLREAVYEAALKCYDTRKFRWAVLLREGEFPWSEESDHMAGPNRRRIKRYETQLREVVGRYFNKTGRPNEVGKIQIRMSDVRLLASRCFSEPDTFGFDPEDVWDKWPDPDTLGSQVRDRYAAC